MHPLPAGRARGDDGQAGDIGAHPLGDAERVHRPGLRQQQRELLAAEPPGQIVITQQGVQRMRDLLDDLIAEHVAIGVVDHLEPVDVQHGHRERRFGPDGAGDLRRRLALPGRRVEQPGLGIDARVFDQPGVAQRPLQQRHEREREDDREYVVGQAECDKHGHTELGHVVEDRLPGELHLAKLQAPIGALDRGQDQAWLTAHITIALAATNTIQARAWPSGSEATPGASRMRAWKTSAARDIAQPDGSRTEHPAVQGNPFDPPLRQGEADDGKERRIGQRQQHRDGQFPDRVHVLDEPGVLADSPGQLDGGRTAQRATRRTASRSWARMDTRLTATARKDGVGRTTMPTKALNQRGSSQIGQDPKCLRIPQGASGSPRCLLPGHCPRNRRMASTASPWQTSILNLVGAAEVLT